MYENIQISWYSYTIKLTTKCSEYTEPHEETRDTKAIKYRYSIEEHHYIL